MINQVTEREIIKLLKDNGWYIEEGSKHHLATNPNKPGIKIPIPRHRKDIPIGTINNILKAAGLK
jgi:predicted RNA binding protein YcfA (HicA-like mRNA interferase family)